MNIRMQKGEIIMMNGNERDNDKFEVNQNGQEQNHEKEIYIESVQRDVVKEDVKIDKEEPMQEEPMQKEQPIRKKSGFGQNAVKLIASAAVFGLVASGVFQGVNYASYRNVLRTETKAGSAKEEADKVSSAVQTKAKEESEYSGVSLIVENAKPSIVAITSTVKEVTYDFFGRPSVSKASGAGSGIIIGQNKDEILIVTNNHVIDGAQNIVIQFNDDTSATASVKGTEVASDLAVVTVKTKELSADTMSKIKIASLGDSSNIKEGELVVAIGNALGYGQSSTVGYVSALNREVTVDDTTTLNLIQTDAAINPGNSGGALINSKGEVIGINSVKLVKTEVEGVGYAIPISEAIPIINDLMNREVLRESEKAYLGIRGEDVGEGYSKSLGLPVGVFVDEVIKKSPASKAGLKTGDVIVGIAGRTIKTQQELQTYLNYTRAGQTVDLKVKELSNGEYVEKTLEVTLGSR